MSARKKILVVQDPRQTDQPLVDRLGDDAEVVVVGSMLRALHCLQRGDFAGVFVDQAYVKEAFDVGRLLQNERVLEGMLDGVVLLDVDNSIIWANGRLNEWSGLTDVVGKNFYAVLGSPEIIGPDFCPFHTALANDRHGAWTILRTSDNRHFQIHASPIREEGNPAAHLIVTIRDVTAQILEQQKISAIHQAGAKLTELKPEDLQEMTFEERIELLKQNILEYTKNLLNFDVIEIRLLDRKTNRLEPLLAVGIEPEAAARPLRALSTGNGVTGFVAATSKSYLCEDTTEDPLYLEGCKGAKSSLTVPLMLHDQVIGTFNVESPQPRAFDYRDLQFLELFTRDLAVALNTLELLAVEKAITAQENVEAIHSAVALPIDVILNDAVNVMEKYIGHDTEVVEKLQRILRHARDIKLKIQKVGQSMAPTQAHPQYAQQPARPELHGKQILVVDADESVRGAAHALLERCGCTVETAHDGGEAVSMVRNFLADGCYDAIISDIRLPDMSGYELLCKLHNILVDGVPMILMTGFGYDPGHCIVKARQAGLQAVLYKPFRLDQLLETVTKVVTSPPIVVRQ